METNVEANVHAAALIFAGIESARSGKTINVQEYIELASSNAKCDTGDRPRKALRRLAESPLRSGERARFLIGAAIGTGMAAQSATRGGADFLHCAQRRPHALHRRAVDRRNAAVARQQRVCAEFRADGNLAARDRAGVSSAPPVSILASTFVISSTGSHAPDSRASRTFPTAILIEGEYRRFLEDAWPRLRA